MYETYNETFFNTIIENTAINTTFLEFADTSLYERYMLNAAQFSAAKMAAENELLAKAAVMQDDTGKLRPYKEYRELAEQITTQSRDTWLRVEYDTQKKNAVSGQQFGKMVDDSDLYPYWRYKGVMDRRERPDHVALEGTVYKIGDPAGDAIFPPGDWNCRCTGIQEDGRYLDENNVRARTNAEAEDLLKEHIDEQFRFNPYRQGTLPNTGHSYFEAMGNANEANHNTFNLPPSRDLGSGTKEGFAATGLHYIINVQDKWRRQYHSKSNGDIIFQNKALYTNVVWTSNSLHAIQKHQRGFENLPATITHPDEVWSTWENTDKQTVVKRTYITFGKSNYLVFTRDGVISDAYALSASSTDKHRIGVIL